MNEEIDVNEVLAAMRLQIGVMAQENAILSARVKKMENDVNLRNCGCEQNN
jgi:uncharacterized protein YoxC